MLFPQIDNSPTDVPLLTSLTRPQSSYSSEHCVDFTERQKSWTCSCFVMVLKARLYIAQLINLRTIDVIVILYRVRIAMWSEGIVCAVAPCYCWRGEQTCFGLGEYKVMLMGPFVWTVTRTETPNYAFILYSLNEFVKLRPEDILYRCPFCVLILLFLRTLRTDRGAMRVIQSRLTLHLETLRQKS